MRVIKTPAEPTDWWNTVSCLLDLDMSAPPIGVLHSNQKQHDCHASHVITVDSNDKSNLTGKVKSGVLWIPNCDVTESSYGRCWFEIQQGCKCWLKRHWVQFFWIDITTIDWLSWHAVGLNVWTKLTYTFKGESITFSHGRWKMDMRPRYNHKLWYSSEKNILLRSEVKGQNNYTVGSKVTSNISLSTHL